MSRPRQLRQLARFRAKYGPWAVVTGASSGIGREIASELAAAGLHVVLVSRRREALDEFAAEISRRHGVDTLVIATDLATPTSLEKIKADTAHLDVGVLVAAAGFGTSGAFVDADADAELTMLDVNCRATLLLCLHFGRIFADRGRGGLVLLGSIVGLQGTPNAAHYAATKAYVQTLAEGLHEELRPRGVDVLVSAPGPVHSGFAERAGMRMGRALQVSDIAVPTLNALGRRTSVAPGGLSKVLTWSLAPLPRTARAKIMGRVMHAMTGSTKAVR